MRLGVGWLGPAATLLLTFGGIARLFSKVVALFYVLTRSYKDAIFFSSLTAFVIVCLFSRSHPSGCEVWSVLIYLPPMAADAEHLCSCLPVVLSDETPEMGPVRQVERKPSRTPVRVMHAHPDRAKQIRP